MVRFFILFYFFEQQNYLLCHFYSLLFLAECLFCGQVQDSRFLTVPGYSVLSGVAEFPFSV